MAPTMSKNMPFQRVYIQFYVGDFLCLSYCMLLLMMTY
jgi:hypothetical protein